ncbi:unnamed protein product [Boreogadus saida]
MLLSLCFPPSVEHGGVWRLKPALKKYACELTLDPNTAHRGLSLSEDNRKVTWVEEHQSVGVYLDRPAGSLSFYSVSPGVGGSSDTLTHLHTFQSTFTKEDLLPGFKLRSQGEICAARRSDAGGHIERTRAITEMQSTRRSKTAEGT